MEENKVKLRLCNNDYKEEDLSKYLLDYKRYRDYFNEYLDPEGEAFKLYYIFDTMVGTKLETYYEYKTLKNMGMYYKDVMKQNKEFLKRAKKEVEILKSLKHLNCLDSSLLCDLESALAENELNIVPNVFYIPDGIDKINMIKNAYLEQLPDLIKTKELSVIEKGKGSKSKVNNHKNYLLFKSYYDVLCSKRDMLLSTNYEDDVKDIDIKRIITNTSKDNFEYLKDLAVNRDETSEFLLLMYILAYKVDSLNIDILKDIYKNDIEDMIYAASNSVNTSIDNMYLSKRINR